MKRLAADVKSEHRQQSFFACDLRNKFCDSLSSHSFVESLCVRVGSISIASAPVVAATRGSANCCDSNNSRRTESGCDTRSFASRGYS